MIYNIFDRSAEHRLFSLSQSHSIGVINRVPFDEGTLAGAILPRTRFRRKDWRNYYFRGDRKAQAYERVHALECLLGDEAQDLAELALRFCLSQPAVSVVIPGMRRTNHVTTNCSAADGRLLSTALLKKLKTHEWKKNWYRI